MKQKQTATHPLQELRVEEGLSREKLAALSGVAPVTIWKIETGTTPTPRSDTLAKLALALSGVSGEKVSWKQLRVRRAR
jgi:transcriptional regulator with XRE-family HTH domain